MISVHIMGGLGNQLFQIFAAFSYALNTEQEIFFPYSENSLGITKRDVYWGSFLSAIQGLLIKSLPKIEVLREKGFEYNRIPKIFGKNIYLYGYFQSYKYFESKYNEICIMIELKKKKMIVKEKYNKYDFSNSISMHFRIGDYINIQNSHPILDKNYYLNALEYLLEKDDNLKTVYYFTEKHDISEVENNISFLKSKLPNIEFKYVHDIEEDWEEMLLMSMCEHNIIANSTFSWWGAYFNSNPDKIVCYPSNWFGPGLTHNTDDLFPTKWIKISQRREGDGNNNI
jgi:hypothetical protein